MSTSLSQPENHFGEVDKALLPSFPEVYFLLSVRVNHLGEAAQRQTRRKRAYNATQAHVTRMSRAPQTQLKRASNATQTRLNHIWNALETLAKHFSNAFQTRLKRT